MKFERREDRELCADLVRVEWEPEFGPPRNEWAILEDISPSGACLESEQPISPNTLVSLQFTNEGQEASPNEICQARIKYCKYDRANYLLGVQFEQGYRWSRRKFKPQHLIQFRLRKVPKANP